MKAKMLLTLLLKRENRDNYKKIKKYKNAYKGQRAWIIGNGPSLCADDLSAIKNEFTFAANKIFYIFDKTDWRPSFYFCQDIRVYKDIEKSDFNELEKMKGTKKFISKYIKDKKCRLEKEDLIYRLYVDKNMKCGISRNFAIYAYEGLSVTYSMIQLAIYMGFEEICLIGIDHTQINVNKKNISDMHFDKRYKIDIKSFPTEEEYEYLTNCFVKANEYCKKKHIKIYNCTKGGMLEVFERKNLDTILNRGCSDE